MIPLNMVMPPNIWMPTVRPKTTRAIPTAKPRREADRMGKRPVILTTMSRVAFTCATALVMVFSGLVSGCQGRPAGQSSDAPASPDPPSYQVTATVPIGKEPRALAVNPDTHTVYVVNAQPETGKGNTVSVFDGATRSVAGVVPVGDSPGAVAVDPDTNTVYVAQVFGNSVTVINGATRQVTATVPVGDLVVDLAVDPRTHTVYTVNTNDKTVSVIDAAKRVVTASVPIGESGSGVAVDPGTNTVYVLTEKICGNAPCIGEDAMTVIDGATRTVTATMPVGRGPRSVAVDPDTHTVYVANMWDSTVSVIDGATRTVKATVPVGISPLGVAVDPGTHTVYVVTHDKELSVIDGATSTVTATVPVGDDPDGVAVDPSTHTVYVLSRGDETVSVIEKR